MSLVDLGKRLLESAKHGETEEVRLLMTNGAPFTTDWLGTSPLHMAAQYGHVTTAEVLLRAGISRDARTKVDRTPLHIASQEGHLDIVELLIKHGAEVDAKDMLRMTPLHWAVERGHIPVINCLLKHNADVHSVSKFDKTPVDVAEDNGLGDVMDILEDHAASPPKTQDSIQKNKPVHMTKVQKILPKPSAADSPAVKTAIPVTIKTESISVAHIKDIVNRTVATNNHAITSTANSTTYTSTTSAKTMPSQRPVYLHANITHLQKAAASSNTNIKSSSSDSEEGETSEQSCTNVLATLAALAEATAPNATISTSEALQWLEMHGITMLPADNTTVVGTALEGGQTVSLTEAGKLALTWVKEHQTLNNNTTEVSSSVQENVQNNNLSDVSTTPNQKVITIVADQLPSIITNQQSPIVVVSGQTVNATGNNNESSPPVKRLKTYLGRKESPKPTTNGKVTSTSLSAEEERCQLQKELEKIKKQAAQYKAQLLLKEHEAEQYRKQLEQIQTVSRSNQ